MVLTPDCAARTGEDQHIWRGVDVGQEVLHHLDRNRRWHTDRPDTGP
jgi:hypothetical protein